MQIVIDIPEELYDRLIIKGKDISEEETSTVLDIIADGTVLPKNHGRLIDADKFIDALFVYGQADDKFKLGELIKYTPSEIWKIVEMLAKTVIEADKEVENDERRI